MNIAGALKDEGAQYREARSRQGIYRLLGRLYAQEIDQHLLDQSGRHGILADLGSMGLEMTPPRDIQAWLEQLAIEYTRLFIGPGAHISPHESVHAPGDNKLLNNERTARVRRFIRVAGFEFKPAYSGFPDHICAEFEFMEALIGCELRGLDGDDTKEVTTSLMLQQEFMSRHLAAWLPAFCKRVIERSKHSFYTSLARVTEQFIGMEEEYLESCNLPED